jgi:predicted RNA-binding protein
MATEETQSNNTWLIVGSEENYDISKGFGFTVQGIKSRHRKKAKLIHPGDRMIYYLTGLQVLAGIVRVTSNFVEDYTPIWTCSSKRTEEVYPFRFRIQPEIILEKEQYLRTVDLYDKIEYLKKWPEAHWRLGFQGNVHHWPESDYQLVYSQMSALTKDPSTATV